MKILTTILLLSTLWCHAQAPSDFVQVYDSITFVADPAEGNPSKQSVILGRVLPGTMALPKGLFKFGLYTGKNSGPVEKYMQFSGFMKDSVDTSSNPTINITITPSSYLAIVPVSAMPAQKRPILRIYTGTTQASQVTMYTSGNYYYVYLRRTAVNQVFRIDYDGSGDTNKMTTLEPVAGKAAVFAPASQAVTINVINPFK